MLSCDQQTCVFFCLFILHSSSQDLIGSTRAHLLEALPNTVADPTAAPTTRADVQEEEGFLTVHGGCGSGLKSFTVHGGCGSGLKDFKMLLSGHQLPCQRCVQPAETITLPT